MRRLFRAWLADTAADFGPHAPADQAFARGLVPEDSAREARAPGAANPHVCATNREFDPPTRSRLLTLNLEQQ